MQRSGKTDVQTEREKDRTFTKLMQIYRTGILNRQTHTKRNKQTNIDTKKKKRTLKIKM